MCTLHGFENLSLEDLARRTGVTRGAVYHHFRSKEGLFEAMLEDRLAWMGERIEKSADEVDDPAGGIRAGCHAFLRHSQDPSYQRIVLLEAPAVLGTELWQQKDYLGTTVLLTEALEDLAESAVGTGAADTGYAHRPKPALPSSRGTAEALSGAMNSLSLWAASGGHSDDAHAALQVLLDAVIGAYSSSSQNAPR